MGFAGPKYKNVTFRESYILIFFLVNSRIKYLVWEPNTIEIYDGSSSSAIKMSHIVSSLFFFKLVFDFPKSTFYPIMILTIDFLFFRKTGFCFLLLFSFQKPKSLFYWILPTKATYKNKNDFFLFFLFANFS